MERWEVRWAVRSNRICDLSWVFVLSLVRWKASWAFRSNRTCDLLDIEGQIGVDIPSSALMQEAVPCINEHQLLLHLDRWEVRINLFNVFQEHLHKVSSPKGGGGKTEMRDDPFFHTIIFLTDCFSDCSKLYGCCHYSIAYKTSSMLYCRSHVGPISWLLCAPVVFLFLCFLCTEETSCFNNSCITNLCFLGVPT